MFALIPILAVRDAWQTLLAFAIFIIIPAISDCVKRKPEGDAEKRSQSEVPTQAETPKQPASPPPVVVRRVPAQPPSPATAQPRPVEHRPVPTPAPAPAPFDWEAELRKLLGEQPTAKPASPAPASVPTPTPPAPIPRRAPAPTAKTVSPTPVVARKVEKSPIAIPAHLAKMDESTRAMEKGAGLDKHVAQHMRDADATTALHIPDRPRAAVNNAVQGAAILRMLRQPQTLRQALVLSEVLGPPRALSERAGV